MTMMLIVFLFGASLMAQTRPTPEQVRQASLLIACQGKALLPECTAIREAIYPWWGKERMWQTLQPLRLRLRISEEFGTLVVEMVVVEKTLSIKTPAEELEFELIAPVPSVMGAKTQLDRLINKIKQAVSNRDAAHPPKTPTRPTRRNTAAARSPSGSARRHFFAIKILKIILSHFVKNKNGPLRPQS